MKLELKHLAPYLPYDLMCEVKDQGKTKHAKLSGAYIDNSCVFFDTVESEHGYDSIRPILRPLSDLQKLVTINDETFAPMQKLFGDKWIEWDGESGCLNSMRDTYNASRGTIEHNIFRDFSQTYILDNLYKWHFDVFGLIKEELAIDINTLK